MLISDYFPHTIDQIFIIPAQGLSFLKRVGFKFSLQGTDGLGTFDLQIQESFYKNFDFITIW